ncbi:release factor glutamine methyltransferase [Nocardiopsis mwathae]|uniref:Release factor glutamine methyltransferase n=1 Tax=Nocardiopsis mwathae TaxID=1472723 RepID=A0A7X0D7V4_9ACTN|nr:methyltransferase domain-containing protein [Nocardiopsis mwathae]MBB6174740.1 release factor glutamine methyltransferase [Nocardiopsis mwathae]
MLSDRYKQAVLSEVAEYIDELYSDERPKEFKLLGLRWTLLHGVYDPSTDPAAWMDVKKTPYPVGGRFLEMGCGAGMASVYGALQGCAEVVAADIAPEALENTRVNAERHGVADRVRTVQSDVFSGIDATERFDAIYWGSPFIEPPDEYGPDEAHPAYFDNGYASHRRFLREARHYLAPGGRLFLGFGTEGNWDLLERIAAESGLRTSVVASTSYVEEDEDDDTVVHEYGAWLVEFLPAD